MNSSLNWFDYRQTLNGVTTENSRNSRNMGAEFRTAYKKWPFISTKYTKGFNEFKGLATSNFQTDIFEGRLEYEVTELLFLKADYENFKNKNSFNQNSRYEIANVSLYFQKKSSAWGFELSANNFLNNTIKITNSFSDYMVSERAIYILPRILLLSVNYKL